MDDEHDSKRTYGTDQSEHKTEIEASKKMCMWYLVTFSIIFSCRNVRVSKLVLSLSYLVKNTTTYGCKSLLGSFLSVSFTDLIIVNV